MAGFSGGRTGQRSHVQQSIRPGEGAHQVTRRSRGRSSHHSNANLQGNDHPFPLVSSSLASQSQQLPLAGRACRCGRLLDSFGHHRAACARAGVLSRRGFSLDSAAARICREAGGRVRTHLSEIWMFRMLDGLPLFGGWQWQSTPPWCTHCMVTADHGGEPPRFLGSQEGLGTKVPRVRWRAGATSIGRPCCGSWGQVLEEDEWVPDSVGKGSGTERNPTHAEAC